MMDFREADRRYTDLKRQYKNGDLSDEEFRTQLEQIAVQDTESRWWVKHRDTGAWHYQEADTWVQGTPPYEAETVDEPPTDEVRQPTSPVPHIEASPSALNWWMLALRGLVVGLFGLVWFFPAEILIISAAQALGYNLILSVLILIDGGLAILASRKTGPNPLLRLQAIVSGLAGLLSLLNLYVIVLWAICLGLIQVIAALRLGRESNVVRPLMISGVLFAVFGILALLLRSGSAPNWYLGILLIAGGISQMVFAFQVRN